MVELMQRTMTRVMSPLYERMFLVLTIVFCSSLAIMVFQVSRLQEHLIEAMVLVNGDLYANVMHQLQTLYAHEVVQRVRGDVRRLDVAVSDRHGAASCSSPLMSY